MKKVIILISLVLLAVSAFLLTRDLKTVSQSSGAAESVDTTANAKTDTAARVKTDTAAVSLQGALPVCDAPAELQAEK